MHLFHIRYRNTQGTLMRILNAASRRGIDMHYVQAEPAEHTHKVTLLLNVNTQQNGQLCRDWRAIVDVLEVKAGAPLKEAFECGWAAVPHPPAPAVLRSEASASA